MSKIFKPDILKLSPWDKAKTFAQNPFASFVFIVASLNTLVFFCLLKIVATCFWSMFLWPRSKLLRSLILELNNAQKRAIFLVNLKYEDNLSIKLKGHVCVTSIVSMVSM